MNPIIWIRFSGEGTTIWLPAAGLGDQIVVDPNASAELTADFMDVVEGIEVAVLPATARPGRASASELAKKQRNISVSEFFAKNRHLLGFDNPSKALLTTIKEAVDNSLDACEEAEILPDLLVQIRMISENRYRIASPDGERLALPIDTEGGYDIAVANLDSGDTTVVIAGPEDELARQWSPDGNCLLYVYGVPLDGGRDYVYRLGILDLATGAHWALSEVALRSAKEGWGVWSPDGTRIAFAGIVEGQERVFVVNVAGKGLVVLSGCFTASGAGLVDEMPDSDDWVSLTRAFIYAGAPSVVATLWPVNDRATAELVIEFYGQLKYSWEDYFSLTFGNLARLQCLLLALLDYESGLLCLLLSDLFLLDCGGIFRRELNVAQDEIFQEQSILV